MAQVERMPAKEVSEWLAFLALKAKGKGPDQSPEQMMTALRSRGIHGR